MNDPVRRRSPDGFDDDAIFADIVAHLNDDLTEVERPARPVPEDAATDVETADTDKPDTDRPEVDAAEIETTEQTPTERTDVAPGDLPRRNLGWSPINPPPGPTHVDPQDVEPQAVAPQTWRAHEVDDEYEDHFEPAPVTPLPAGDLQFWAIIAGMAGGPLLLLYLVFFNRDASSYWILTAIAMSVGGFALLVARMPGQHEDDDDGARL